MSLLTSTWPVMAEGTEVLWKVAEDGVCQGVWFTLELKHSL